MTVRIVSPTAYVPPPPIQYLYLDDDGEPYFSPAKPGTHSVLIDSDGEPYWVAGTDVAGAKQINLDSDGTPFYVDTAVIVGVGETFPHLVLGYELNFESRNIIHNVLDRSDPEVTLHEPLSRSGTLELFYLTEATALAAVNMHRQRDRFVFTDSDRPALNMTYVVDEGTITVTLDDETRVRWVVSIPYREVAA